MSDTNKLYSVNIRYTFYSNCEKSPYYETHETPKLNITANLDTIWGCIFSVLSSYDPFDKESCLQIKDDCGEISLSFFYNFNRVEGTKIRSVINSYDPEIKDMLDSSILTYLAKCEQNEKDKHLDEIKKRIQEIKNSVIQ